MPEITIKGKGLIKKIAKTDAEYNTYIPLDGELVCVTDGDNARLVVGDGTSTVDECKSVGSAGTRLMEGNGSIEQPVFELLSESEEEFVYDPDETTSHSIGFPRLYATCIETDVSDDKTVHKTIDLQVSENGPVDYLGIGTHTYPLERQPKIWMKTVNKPDTGDWTVAPDVTADFIGQLCSVYEYTENGDTNFEFKQLWIVEERLDENYDLIPTWKKILELSV